MIELKKTYTLIKKNSEGITYYPITIEVNSFKNAFYLKNKQKSAIKMGLTFAEVKENSPTEIAEVKDFNKLKIGNISIDI